MTVSVTADHICLRRYRFAGSLLKRTLSESVAGGGTDEAEAAELYPRERTAPRRLALAARSLSLQLARHRHRLAAQLVSRDLNQCLRHTICIETRIVLT